MNDILVVSNHSYTSVGMTIVTYLLTKTPYTDQMAFQQLGTLTFYQDRNSFTILRYDIQLPNWWDIVL